MKENPEMVVIVGSSLSNERLLSDIKALCKRGIPVYIVNPNASNNFKNIDDAHLVRASAEELSEALYGKLMASSMFMQVQN
jgi:hypothetical protein